AGWDMPIQYSSIIAEHTAVRTQAGLFDVSHMGRLVFQGPEADVVAFLQLLFTNDVASMATGQVRYGLLCNEQGGILDDVLVYRLGLFWMMVVNASNRAKILAWMARQRDRFPHVQVHDHTVLWSMVAIQGPKAREIVTTCRSADAVARLDYYHAAVFAAGTASGFDLDAILSRTGYTGEDGFELIVPAAGTVALVDLLSETARKLGVTLQPCGLGARDTLRLEAGMPLYGHELNEEIDPFQARLGWAVKMSKGDFLGREALLRCRQDATLRQRVGLELDGRRIAREGAAVLFGGQEIGRVSSGTFGPTLQKVIAMAYVNPSHAAAGTADAVDVRGKAEAARVVPLPFYKRPKT
ncbi:MAG TPA: glycine cleavage system aminomethyltransferase GcvT, partial [Pirellulales bacterium]